MEEGVRQVERRGPEAGLHGRHDGLRGLHLEVRYIQILVQPAEVDHRTPLAGSFWSDEEPTEEARTIL